jgi:hypothetical protein
MQRLEVSGALRHIYDIMRQRVKNNSLTALLLKMDTDRLSVGTISPQNLFTYLL